MDDLVEVSVLIPVYNVEKYLRQCLESVIHQTLSNIEIICIDDGSTDDSGEILDEYASRDKRICVLHKANTGYGNSMNVGLHHAKGKYIAIIESDDFAEANMLECLLKYAVAEQADIVKADYYNYENGEDRIRQRLKDYTTYQLLSYKECPELMKIADSIWSAIYRREFLIENNITFNETPGASFQDTSFAAICWLFAERVYFINEIVLHYRMDNVNSSIHAPGKVFCICDEWKRVEMILDRFPQKKEIVQKYQIAMKYQGYLFNYYRLSACYQYALLVRIADELKRDSSKGILEKESFEPSVWEQVTDIIADKDRFFIETAKEVQDERMEECKTLNREIYYQAFIQKIKKYRTILIYGAGKIGQETAKRLRKENVEITSFVVSEDRTSCDICMGITIKKVQEFSKDSGECVIIIAVGEKYQNEIYKVVQNYDFKNVFLIDKMLRKYISQKEKEK